MVDGVSQVAQFDVVVIDRGERYGVEEAHVLQVDRAGETIRKVIAGGGAEVKLPDEEAGVLMVFRVDCRTKINRPVSKGGWTD